MRTVDFGRGGGMFKAPKAAVPVAAGGSAWSGFNGVQGGKRGFQKGNPGGPGRAKGTKVTGAKKPRSSVSKASTAHRSARTAVAKHIKAGTALTPAGRTAIKTAAAASRTLQTAHADAAALRSAQGKATRAVASGRASTLPKPGEKPISAPAPAPKPSNVKAVKAGAKEASDTKVARATTHLGDLHAGVKGGSLKPTDIHKHVDRIARGTTKAELFAAAKAHGIEHSATTKKSLVSHLKDHASGLNKPAAPKPEAAKPKAETKAKPFEHDTEPSKPLNPKVEAAKDARRAEIKAGFQAQKAAAAHDRSKAQHPDTAPVVVQHGAPHSPREAIPPRSATTPAAHIAKGAADAKAVLATTSHARGTVAERAKAAADRAGARVRVAEVEKRKLIHDSKGGLNKAITPEQIKQSQRHDRTIQRHSGRIDQLHQARRDLENAAHKKAKGAKP